MLWLAGLTLAATVLGACSSGTAHDSGDYLALGDSIAFGYQPASVTPAARYKDADNFTGYPEFVAKANRLTLTNASCPGESSTSLITAGVSDNGCSAVAGTTSEGYRSQHPLHTRYSGSQLSFAVQFLRTHKQTKLISLDIGVNDLLVCSRVTPTHCIGAAGREQLAETSRNLSTIFTTLRDTAGYTGTIVLLTSYPSSYAGTTQTAAFQALNTTLVAAAKRFDIKVADGFGAFEKPAAAFAGDPCQAGLLIPLSTTGCDYHPSAQGQQLLAGAVEKAAG
jgi:lysophospholipase L1-like esterase